MGYFPNTPASSLRSKKTNTIGVMVSRINRPFISTLISGVEEVANSKGYHVFIAQSEDMTQKEISNARAMFSARVDGLIVSLAMETHDYGHFDVFLDSGTPLVFVDRVPANMAADKVVVDNYEAAFKMTQHLIEQGCNRIAHFGGAQHRDVYRLRKEGYLAALKQHNLPIDESLMIYSNLGAEEGLEMTQRLFDLPVPPDAIFSANDTAAVSAIQFAKDKGIAIPKELAVAGFNNDRLASIIAPALTTVANPAFDLGKAAASQLFAQREENDMVASNTTVLKTELIVRESSLKKGR